MFSIANYSYNYFYNDRYWADSEQTKLGMWFNDYDSDKISNVLFDMRDSGKIDKDNQLAIYSGRLDFQTSTIMGFWMNDNLFVGDVNETSNVDYIISRHDLDFPVLYETDNGIYLYELK